MNNNLPITGISQRIGKDIFEKIAVAGIVGVDCVEKSIDHT